MKKFWDANYPGGSYDAIGRRQGGLVNNQNTTSHQHQQHPVASKATGGLAQSTDYNKPTRQPQDATAISSSTQKVAELIKALLEMERERDFYFNKLRDIEIICQKTSEPSLTETPLFRDITRVLYATEDGFEVPEGTALMQKS